MWFSNAVPTLTYSLLASRLPFPLTQQYLFNPETGSFRHHKHHVSRDRRWLSSISYDSGDMVYPRSVENPPPSFEVTTTANTCIYFYDESCIFLQDMLLAAEKLLEQASQFKVNHQCLCTCRPTMISYAHSLG